MMFVYPSIYEGFGMPILEAMQCGCPCVIANASCFPEIAKDAAGYFNPHDVDSIVYAMGKVLEDSDYHKELVEKGYLRVNDFSWKKTADAHIKVYESLV